MGPKGQVFEIGIPTADGEFVARYSDQGLCGLEFPGAKRSKAGKADEPTKEVRAWHTTSVKALARALAGQPVRDLPALDLSSGTNFQRSVWLTLCKIGCGETWSYADVARAIGNVKATRAVGGACGANPIPVLVPCHRVLAANRKIGGFSGGLDWKRKLLEREGGWTESLNLI